MVQLPKGVHVGGSMVQGGWLNWGVSRAGRGRMSVCGCGGDGLLLGKVANIWKTS